MLITVNYSGRLEETILRRLRLNPEATGAGRLADQARRFSAPPHLGILSVGASPSRLWRLPARVWETRVFHRLVTADVFSQTVQAIRLPVSK